MTKKSETRKKLNTLLISKNPQDIHQIVAGSSENDSLAVEIMCDMCEAVQSQVYFNFLAYSKTGKKALENTTTFLRAQDLKTEGLFKNTAGLERMLAYFAVKLYESGMSIENLQFFEDWYNYNLPCAESTYIYFYLVLFKQFEEKETMKFMDKIYHFRDIFKKLDFNTSSSPLLEELKVHIVSAMINEKLIFSKDAHGRDFLAVAISQLDDETCKFCLELVTKAVVHFKKKSGEKYGHIIFKSVSLALKDKKSQNRAEIVSDYIQEIMHTTCFMNNESNFKEFRCFLKEIYKHRQESGINLMLYHAWRPIIFKCLKHENSQIRYNACRLLDDSYPINDESLNQEEAREMADLTHAQLVGLLRDNVPQIRIQAVMMVRVILSSIWDSILPQVIMEWLKVWLGKLTLDSSSPAVRVASYKELAGLIQDQPLAHPLLAKLMSKINWGLHDVNDKVRSAFADVLLACKKTQIPYTNAAGTIDMILARIEDEKSEEIQQKLATLVADVFFKPKEDPTKQVKRLSVVLKKNYIATRTVFYYISSRKFQARVYPSMESPQVHFTKFLESLANLIRNNLKKAKDHFEKNLSKISLDQSNLSQATPNSTQNNTPNTTQNMQNGTQNTAALNTSLVLFRPEETEVLISFLEISSILITNILPKADRETSKTIQVTYKDIVHSVLRLIEDPRAARAALYLARKLPANAVTIISNQAIKRLKNAKDQDSKTLLMPFIECIIEWQWMKPFSEMLVQWFGDTLKVENSKKGKNNGKNDKDKGKNSQIQDSEENKENGLQKAKGIRFNLPEDKPRPVLAIRYTDWILESHFISREIASTDIVYELRDALQPILTLVKKRFGQKWVSPVHIKKDEILIDCLRVFLRLIIFGDITLADKKWSEKARRYSVTPKKHQTPIQTNNNFDGTKLILNWISKVICETTETTITDQFDQSQQKIFKKCTAMSLEFMSNLVAVNQKVLPESISCDVAKIVRKIWDLGVSTDFDKMANTLVATRQEVKINKILKSFLKEELFDVNLARTNVGILLAKNVGKEEIEKIVKVLMQDVEIEVRPVEDKEFYFSGLQTRKSQFLMSKVINRLEGVKFDEFDKILAEQYKPDGDIPGDEIQVTALVFHMNRKKWKHIFKELKVEEDVFKRFRLAESDDTQDEDMEGNDGIEGEEMKG